VGPSAKSIASNKFPARDSEANGRGARAKEEIPRAAQAIRRRLDLEPELLGRVEDLIDFVTAPVSE
jgi:hypothetical protein